MKNPSLDDLLCSSHDSDTASCPLSLQDLCLAWTSALFCADRDRERKSFVLSCLISHQPLCQCSEGLLSWANVGPSSLVLCLQILGSIISLSPVQVNSVQIDSLAHPLCKQQSCNVPYISPLPIHLSPVQRAYGQELSSWPSQSFHCLLRWLAKDSGGFHRVATCALDPTMRSSTNTNSW